MNTRLLLGLVVCVIGCTKKGESPAKPSANAPMVFELNVADDMHQGRVHGFYPGTAGWRWTGKRFSVNLDVPPPVDEATFLDLNFAVPVELIGETRDVTVTAKANGLFLAKKTYTEKGEYHFGLEIPQAILKRASPVFLEFELDKTARDRAQNRDLGVIVVDVALRHPPERPVSQAAAAELAKSGYADVLRQRKSKIDAGTQNEWMRLFHDIPVWRNVWFHNVRIEKNPLDLWMMQQVIYEVQPDFIIETGTWMGGSALYWAHTLNGMGLEKSRVITVDLQNAHATAATHPLWKKYVDFMQGSSTDEKIVAQIAARTSGRKTLVTLDSDHAMQHVLNELRAYAPMVSKKSYVIVEDSHMDGVPTQPGFGPGPMEAILRFLKEKQGAEFEQDFSREAMIMTFNPGGWLRRK